MGRPGNLGAAAVRTRAQRLTGASDWICTACRWAVGGALERADAESEDAEAEATIARHRSGGSVGYQPSCGKHRMFCMGGGGVVHVGGWYAERLWRRRRRPASEPE